MGRKVDLDDVLRVVDRHIGQADCEMLQGLKALGKEEAPEEPIAVGDEVRTLGHEGTRGGHVLLRVPHNEGKEFLVYWYEQQSREYCAPQELRRAGRYSDSVECPVCHGMATIDTVAIKPYGIVLTPDGDYSLVQRVSYGSTGYCREVWTPTRVDVINSHAAKECWYPEQLIAILPPPTRMHTTCAPPPTPMP